MAKQIRKVQGRCQVVLTEFNGRITMKCKNLKRKPTKKEALNSAQSIIESAKGSKIIYK